MLRVDGGLTRDPLLLQLQADAAGVAVEPGAVDATAAGSAALAAVGAGLWGSTLEIADHVPVGDRVAPQHDRVVARRASLGVAQLRRGRRSPRVSGPADLWAKISPGLANRPGTALLSRVHAWLVRRSGGRLGRFVGVEVLILRTTGRRSGKPRESPMFFLEHGEALAVVASNAAATRTPAWWLNLQAHPDAEAYVKGRAVPVRGREATSQEAELLWPRFDALYAGYERYREISSRELPVIVLEPRSE